APSNQTQTIEAPSNQTQTIQTEIITPNATQSWSFNNSINGSQFIGSVQINQTGIVLDGGYIKSNQTLDDISKGLSITVWIKPDYSSGISKFTIVSKDKSFELTLNNNQAPEHKATFSIFDGIKWHSIDTAEQIGQDWSHIAAAFNGTNLTLYTNGTLSSTVVIPQQTGVNASTGALENIIPQIALTNSDVVIGATLDSREVDESQSVFSGTIDLVNVFASYLSAEQIRAIYESELPLIQAKSITNQTIQIELPPINLLNSTGINGTINTNSTQFVVVPPLNYTNKMTLAAWISPDYTNAADEMTILSKENSFALSINNVLSPQKTAKISVSDGIKWTELTSKDAVNSPTHVVAVINGTQVYLYLNGTIQSKTEMPDSFVINDGELTTTESSIANSNSSIVIGAYLSTLRNEPQITNPFSGTISDVLVYPRALGQDEIMQLYAEKLPKQNLLPLTENMSFLEQIETGNKTAITVLNTTELTVQPELVQLKPSYLINEPVEFELKYFDQNAVIHNEIASVQFELNDILNEIDQTLQTAEDQVIEQPAPSDSDSANTSELNTSPIEQQVSQGNDTQTSLTNQTSSMAYIVASLGKYLKTRYNVLPAAHADNSTNLDALSQIQQTKLQLQTLKEKIEQIKTDNSENKEALLSEIKSEISSLSEQLKTLSDSLDNTPQEKPLDDLAQNLQEIPLDNGTEVQRHTWQDQNSTITVEVYDSQGTLIQTLSEYEKIRDGKFNIRLSSNQTVIPGVYHVKTILDVNGDKFELQDEFAWGLVSVNTKKSIYKPGETADFVIVVLDNEGHPVCDSHLDMTVTDPQNHTSSLSSGNGITQNKECGLYDSKYTTSSEGNYTVNISATTPNGKTSFSTYFESKESFDYDIVRTAQSKIDPINNPNSFQVTINVESFVGGGNITIRE
ncbi:MAG: hypothetical protein EB167_08930, partial [Nitrososphaeria archaeon]|nr:hypothetical protein [Nitrososphaeria archaeon]